MADYTPRKGEFIALTLDPNAGHEQRGRRPALVVSNDLFNEGTGMAVVCPVTRNAREHPFHVPVPTGQDVSGVVMVEQVKSVDFRARSARRICQASPELVDEVLAILDACLY